MSGWIVTRTGEILVHPNDHANPETFRTVMAPERDDLVVAVACLFTWDGLADLCARAGSTFVLGPARSMQAIPGGNATHDRLEAQNIAVRLRGGMLPQAYV